MISGNRKTQFKGLRSESGILTVDFLFGMVVSLGLLTVFFALSFSLSMVEVAQYVAFSTARAMAAADTSIDQQKDNAQRKFTSLVNKPALQNLFASKEDKFFPLTQLEIKEGGDSTFDNYQGGSEENRVPQTGVAFQMEFKLLTFNLPLLGSTASNDGGYSSRITGLLIREPSQQECLDQMKARYQAFKNLEASIPTAGAEDYAAVMVEDNGC